MRYAVVKLGYHGEPVEDATVCEGLEEAEDTARTWKAADQSTYTDYVVYELHEVDRHRVRAKRAAALREAAMTLEAIAGDHDSNGCGWRSSEPSSCTCPHASQRRWLYQLANEVQVGRHG